MERSFIAKRIETETVQQTNLINAAVELAIANTHRKKGARRKDLWRRKSKGQQNPVPWREVKALRNAFKAKPWKPRRK